MASDSNKFEHLVYIDEEEEEMMRERERERERKGEGRTQPNTVCW